MTGRAKLALAAAAAVLAGGAAVAAPSSGDSTYRVDVVFDDSRGLVPGQLVQVAGARVGTIDDVTLTRDFKSRVHMKVDRRFAPFRTDATCTIKPQGLIAENYVECVPGSPDAKPLKAEGDRAPTVPVERTTQPVSLTDLFEIWDAPTRDRAHVLLSTLGIATAARGEDINAILRRANPTLELARRTIATLEAQRDDLTSIVDASDTVAASLARRPERLRGLVRHAARVTTQTAGQRAAPGEGVRRLPALLRDVRPALQKLDATMEAGRPLFDGLTDAAPAVNRVSGDVPRLARVAGPSIARLAPVLRAGAATTRRAAPVLRLVQQYAASSLPTATVAGVLFSTLEQRGFTKDFLEMTYNGALAAARYDRTSHILPAHVTLSQCSQWSATPVAGCGSNLEAQRKRAARERDEPRQHRTSGRRSERGQERPSGAPAGRDERPRPSTTPKLPDLPRLPSLPKPELPKAPQLPLHDVPIPQVPLPKDAPQLPQQGKDDTTTRDLLDYLLG